MGDVARNRILVWSIVLSVAWPVIFVLSWSGSDAPLIGAPVILLLWAATALLALTLAVGFALGRSWLWCLAASPLPLTALVALLNIGWVWRAGQIAGDYVHFVVRYPSYISEISNLPSDQPRLIVDDWGGFSPGSHGLVYDESDEITKPMAERSEAWRKRARRTEAECVYNYRPIGGHFYLVALDC
jgi:hypothetical protein